MDSRKHPDRFFRHLASAPFIYAMAVPLIVLDATMEIYHRVCFPLYGIPLVNRKQYIFISRQKLQYLDLLDKMHCAYCSYANGVFRYGAEIAAHTERYWCGVQEQSNSQFKDFNYRESWPAYGDREAFVKEYPSPFERQARSRAAKKKK
jgi:hypothetical protein